MREALGAAVAGVLIAVGGLAAHRSTTVALQEVGKVLVYGGAVVFVVGCGLAIWAYQERERWR